MVLSRLQREAYNERKQVTLAKSIAKDANELEKLQRRESKLEHSGSKKKTSRKSKK